MYFKLILCHQGFVKYLGDYYGRSWNYYRTYATVVKLIPPAIIKSVNVTVSQFVET